MPRGASAHLAAGGGGASGSVPANIIRSRDTGILIRVDGVSHDSLRFASRAYAAALVRLDERALSRGVDSRVPVRRKESLDPRCSEQPCRRRQDGM